ncbi:amino acid transporter AVT6C-like [Carica papaya]|uniref:amino acid transporter AVT6C-like n=1 Tax=Carica papaya TaxID=3649 RepID=UPI000B8CF544|nr:amino acid transporter AVT6C-like [Carica papaya]XP_021904093.1 amino acid transporter AVT6C-like [Carica papaya]
MVRKSNSSSQDPILGIPLLQEATGCATMSSAVFNISTTMVGAGIMSVPATMKTLGVIPGLIAILVVGFFTEVTVEFLLRFTQSGKCSTYGGLMAESFGQFGSVAVQICVMVTNLGCLMIYLIILGDVLCGNRSGESIHTGILQEFFGIHWWSSRAFVILLVVLFVMLPLALLRQVDSLRHSSAVSIGLAIVFVVISSVMAIHALWTGKTQNPRLIPDFTKVSVLDLFTTIPIFVTGFGFHVVVHPIKAELQKSSDMSLAVRISLLICITIYFTIGFFGYLLFGDAIMPDMLVNFDQNSDSSIGLVINDIVRLSYAIHLALVFPLMNYSLRANVDEFLFPKKPALALDTIRFVSLTCGLLTITYIVAVALPNIWYFFQFMGSTTIVCLSFIFPAAIVLRDVHGISTKKDKVVAILVIILAVMTSAVAIYTSLLS